MWKMATFIRIGTALLPRRTITHVNRDTTTSSVVDILKNVLKGNPVDWTYKPMLVVHNILPSQQAFVFGFITCTVFEPYEMLTTRKTKIVFDSFPECDAWYELLQQVIADKVVEDKNALLRQLDRKSVDE